MARHHPTSRSPHRGERLVGLACASCAAALLAVPVAPAHDTRQQAAGVQRVVDTMTEGIVPPPDVSPPPDDVAPDGISPPLDGGAPPLEDAEPPLDDPIRPLDDTPSLDDAPSSRDGDAAPGGFGHAPGAAD